MILSWRQVAISWRYVTRTVASAFCDEEWPNLLLAAEIPCNLSCDLRSLAIAAAMPRCTQVRGHIPDAVGSLSQMSYVLLWINWLRGPVPDVLGSYSDALELSLAFNELRGPIPHALCSLSKIKEFHIWHNEMSGPIPDAFGSFSQDHLSTPNPQVCGLSFSTWVKRKNSLVKRPDSPY